MLLELAIFLLLGVIAGIFTGLMPGIHINLVATFVVSSITLFPREWMLPLAAGIASMSIAHTFIDFIPSVFLGAPEEDTFLAVLPGHELLKEGKGYEAVVLSLYGSLTAIPIILICTPLYIYFLPSFFDFLKQGIPFLLILISSYLLLREPQKCSALIIFVLSGIIGFLAFNTPVREPLLPLLTGLFGISALLTSIPKSQSINKQDVVPLRSIKLTKQEYNKAALAALISAPLCSFLPGIGSGHAAVIGSEIVPQQRRGFLVVVGAISTIVMALSFVTIYSIGKARSGTAAAVQQILKEISLQDMIILLISIVLAAILSFIAGIALARLAAQYIWRVNYKHITYAVCILLVIVNILVSNFFGLIVLVTATAVGVFCISSGTRRINLMGALIVPAILFYLVG